MTLRDLTKRQLYNLRRRCVKEWKHYDKHKPFAVDYETVWNTAYNKGLKAGLGVNPKIYSTTLF